uniref:G-protein coupled receptors family 1 profile domain-containing protein n=1 Tax=Acrobeloides nanus TaxID=290746 RepID=A0A914C5Y6_9BILA
MARRQSETIIKKASITTANLNLNESNDRRVSCFVERKKTRRPRIYIYLLWMTGCDIVLLICALINFSIPTMLDCLSGYYAVFMPIWYILCNAAFTASVWLMLSLVRDRYRLLCCRFADSVAAKSRRTIKNIHWILFALSATSIFFSLPRFFEIDVFYNRTLDQYYIEPSELVENGLYILSIAALGVHASNFIVVLSSASTFFTFFVFSTKFRASIVSYKAQKVIKS